MAKKGHGRPPGGMPKGMRMGPGMPSPQALARQVAEMQAKLEQEKAALAEATFTGTAGGGLVTAIVRGSGEVESVRLDPSVLEGGDVEMVGDLVVAAVNVALRQMQEAAAASLGDLGGLGGPGPGSLGLDDLRGLLG